MVARAYEPVALNAQSAGGKLARGGVADIARSGRVPLEVFARRRGGDDVLGAVEVVDMVGIGAPVAIIVAVVGRQRLPLPHGAVEGVVVGACGHIAAVAAEAHGYLGHRHAVAVVFSPRGRLARGCNLGLGDGILGVGAEELIAVALGDVAGGVAHSAHAPVRIVERFLAPRGVGDGVAADQWQVGILHAGARLVAGGILLLQLAIVGPRISESRAIAPSRGRG